MTVPAYSTWANKDTVTIKSVEAFTDYEVRVRLSADNFDFSKALPDGEDIRFGSGVTALSYWKEEWDDILETAQIWVKVPSVIAGTTLINIYSGKAGAVSESNGVNTFAYYNALATNEDLAELTGSFGTSTWTVIPQSSSPTGFAVDSGNVSGGDAGRYVAASLPGNHVVQTTTANVSASGSWQGPLVNMSDSSNYYRPGTNQTAGLTTAQIREIDAGVATNHGIGIANGANATLFVYQKQITRWQDLLEPSFSSSFAAPSIPVLQGLCNDGVNIFISGSDNIGRFTLAGVEEQTVSVDPGGTSWGDCEIKDGLLYVVRFNSTTSSQVYTFDPADLSIAPILVADISGDMDTGANALVWTGNHWLVGETDATSSNIHVYVYDELWVLQKSIITPRLQRDTSGWQGGTFVSDSNTVYLCDHGGCIGAFLWNEKTLTLDIMDRIESTESDAQSLTWDPVNSTFYLGVRFTTLVREMVFTPHATSKIVWTHWEGDGKSMSCPFFNVVTADQNVQSQIGIGTFRQSRATQLFVRTGGIEPLAIVTEGASSIEVPATVGAIDYSENNTLINLTGSYDVNSTLGSISISSDSTTINLSGSYDLSVNVGQISYSSSNATITMSGVIDIQSLLGEIAYDGNSATIKLGTGQVIGGVTASFKPTEITVNFKL